MGKTYNQCTKVDNGKPWCATVVNNSGYMLPGAGQWGDCKEGCPGNKPYDGWRG